MNELVNIIAPLLVQLLGAIVLAVASAALLKARTYLDAKLSVEQRTFLAQLATTAVHLAETQGAGKSGALKAMDAQDYVVGELTANGTKTVKVNDIESTVVGAVQRAWSDEIGETYHKTAVDAPVEISN